MFILATCNLAVMFIESMQNVANAATVSQGATKKLGMILYLYYNCRILFKMVLRKSMRRAKI